MTARNAVHSGQRQTPHVMKGKAQHSYRYTPNCFYAAVQPGMVVVQRQRPGVGYRHVLTIRDVCRFLKLLPNWNTLSDSLNGIVLAPGEERVDGRCWAGVIAVCAWPADLWREHSPWYFDEHADIFERLGVVSHETSNGLVRCEWTDPAVRAYQLLHILLHELGHHHDRMTSRRRRVSGRGEKFAEDYAREHEAALWDAYVRAFPLW